MKALCCRGKLYCWLKASLLVFRFSNPKLHFIVVGTERQQLYLLTTPDDEWGVIDFWHFLEGNRKWWFYYITRVGWIFNSLQRYISPSWSYPLIYWWHVSFIIKVIYICWYLIWVKFNQVSWKQTWLMDLSSPGELYARHHIRGSLTSPIMQRHWVVLPIHRSNFCL